MKRNVLLSTLLVLCAVVALVHVVRFAQPSFSEVIADRTLLAIAGIVKLTLLVTAAVFAWRSSGMLESGNPAKRAWATLGGGLTLYSAGQGTLLWYQATTGTTPFPSIADVWFLGAYALLVVALVDFSITYAKSGLTHGNVAVVAGLSAVIAAALAWPLLAPVMATEADALVTALNLAYPVLDLVLLIPAIVLLQLTVGFRGGAVWRVWAALLVGVLFTALGDIGFAYFSSLGMTQIDPLVHVVYLIAYASMAVGTNAQYRLLAPAAAVAPATAATPTATA